MGLDACRGAEAAFLVGPTWLHDWARRRLAAVPNGSRRRFPSPFSLLHFAYGLSEVSWCDYSISLITIRLGTVLFCGMWPWPGMWPASARC